MRVAAKELDALEGGQSADYGLLEDIMRYVTGYSDAHHHPTEDVLYDELKSRSPAVAAQVEAIVGEHETLIDRGREFLETIEAVEDGAIISRDALLAVGREYIDTLGRHMGIEEKRLFPLASSELTDEAWSAMDERIERAPDPLFGSSVDERFRRLWQRIEAHTT